MRISTHNRQTKGMRATALLLTLLITTLAAGAGLHHHELAGPSPAGNQLTHLSPGLDLACATCQWLMHSTAYAPAGHQDAGLPVGFSLPLVPALCVLSPTLRHSAIRAPPLSA